jgi:hypothetical protein
MLESGPSFCTRKLVNVLQGVCAELGSSPRCRVPIVNNDYLVLPYTQETNDRALQFPQVIEVSFGVWGFRGLWRNPAPDCKMPLDHIIPHFSNANTHPDDNLDRFRSRMQLPRRVSCAVFEAPCIRPVKKSRGGNQRRETGAQHRSPTMLTLIWLSTSTRSSGQCLPTSGTLNSRAYRSIATSVSTAMGPLEPRQAARLLS